MLGLLSKSSFRTVAHTARYSPFLKAPIARRTLLQSSKMSLETIAVLNDAELADGQM